jgi:hypothetical protein
MQRICELRTKSIRAGLRHLVDRKDRRDLSLFQIGLRLIERNLLRQLPVSSSLCPYVPKLSGG